MISEIGQRSRVHWGKFFRYASAYLYIAPAALIFLIFTIGPALFVLYISLFNWNFLNQAMSQFVGLSNYEALLTSSQFWHSLLISLYFTIGTVPVAVILALVIAMVLMQQFPGRGFVRLSVLSPYVTPVVATSIIWIWILNPQFGLLNDILHALHLPEVGWLESPHWALIGVIIYTLWHSLGFDVIIFMAGLSGISGELREAARIDGANRWREFWSITWPLLTPITLFVMVISVIGSMQAFTQFYTMTEGGPLSATTTASFLLYSMAFVYYQTGPAAALAVLLFIIIGGLTALQLILSQRRVFYQ
jgi:multiple sugar transport system permease protein